MLFAENYMPASRINMRKIKDALRLKFDGGLSHQQIAGALGISKGVVTKYVGLAVAAGLDWQAIATMDEATLERRLLASPRPSDTYAQPDYGRIHQELGRKGVTLMLLWEEYCAQVGNEYSADNPVKPWRYSQFCENYRQFAKRLKRSMRQIHRAGEKLFIDYAGPTITLVAGGQEVERANIFVAALGVSGHCFYLATPAQTAADWLGATAQALAFYGGVPQLIVPNNPRALVTVAERYEPGLTQTVQDFARHYGCSVLPARAYHPQDKPKVELSVLLVERWILARLRKFQFASIEEVNDAICPLLHWLNQRAFQKLPGSSCQRVCPNRCSGPDGLARATLGMGGLQNGARAHRQPCRIRGSPLQRAQRPGGPGAGAARHCACGGGLAPWQPGCQPHALCPQRRIHHRDRAPA